MKINENVQFVRFETTLGREEFIKRWEQFSRSVNSNTDVTLQQSEKNGQFSYIAQHRFASDGLEFKFSNEGRTSRIVQVSIKTIQAGGYSIIQTKRSHHTSNSESKIFVFLTILPAELNSYKNLFDTNNLNIYQAYYENCKYSYILEYYIKTKDAPALILRLKEHDITDAAIYKEWAHIKDTNQSDKKAYVWPN